MDGDEVFLCALIAVDANVNRNRRIDAPFEHLVDFSFVGDVQIHADDVCRCTVLFCDAADDPAAATVGHCANILDEFFFLLLIFGMV